MMCRKKKTGDALKTPPVEFCLLGEGLFLGLGHHKWLGKRFAVGDQPE